MNSPHHMPRYEVAARVLAVLLLTFTAAAPAAELQDECGACHIVYPAKLLPAQSWQQVMGSLAKHFGTDASLDPAAAKRIEALLVQGAGQPRRMRLAPGQPAPLRITEMQWFLREHDEIPPSRWRSPKVRSASRCEACHVNAERGQFDDDDKK
jgi:hypothetical protein